MTDIDDTCFVILLCYCKRCLESKNVYYEAKGRFSEMDWDGEDVAAVWWLTPRPEQAQQQQQARGRRQQRAARPPAHVSAATPPRRAPPPPPPRAAPSLPERATRPPPPKRRTLASLLGSIEHDRLKIQSFYGFHMYATCSRPLADGYACRPIFKHRLLRRGMCVFCHGVFLSIVVQRSAADRGAAEPPVCGLTERRPRSRAPPPIHRQPPPRRCALPTLSRGAAACTRSSLRATTHTTHAARRIAAPPLQHTATSHIPH